MDKRKLYIVGISGNERGLLSIVTSVMNHIIFAVCSDKIPIVDLKHGKNIYFKDGREFRDNIWEYFFKQPFGLSLSDISDNDDIEIALDSHFAPNGGGVSAKHMPISNESRVLPAMSMAKQYYKKYFVFNDETMNFLEYQYANITRGRGNILGILCRGTDYSKRRTFAESIQPKNAAVVKKTREVLNKFPDITNIYLATEDAEIYEVFKKEFGGLLLENGQYRYNYTKEYDGKFISQIETGRCNHHYSLAREYLASIYILSKCPYFIGGRCNGSLFVWLLSEAKKYFYVWQLGNYGRGFREKMFSVSMVNNKRLLRIFGLKIKLKG